MVPDETTKHVEPVKPHRPPAVIDDGSAQAAVDEAVAESFPASDPQAPSVPRARQEAEEAKALVDEALDDALDDTFPASDPPAMTQPPPENE